ncbi:Aste57867_5731 [Aphanomyces stellatus]|uniref:Aste57867_2995 protein n=1 Tax=Aphanomyces stellatus TaxID=120398 RepID=A0A485KEH0_9STRA|nr:hypothetical protein As57867_005718 [Aphanomyces stellatus]KAF0716167.1 hypothetical protein As57867_002986 [Aphanomyces stellatus]VFT80177.1 Aste57867_2995 [Aphanomyces stellatus]VFT82762.1 Aste57867_5731 [Aphanomyces stellatus]
MLPNRSERRASSRVHVEAFHSALQRGDGSAVRTILAHDPYVAHIKNNHAKNTTSLKAATHAPNAIEMLSLLWCHHASLNSCDSDGRTVLPYACEQGAAPATRECLFAWSNRLKEPLLDWGQCTKNGYGPIVLAMRSGNIDLVEFLAMSMPAECLDELPKDVVREFIPRMNDAFVDQCINLPSSRYPTQSGRSAKQSRPRHSRLCYRRGHTRLVESLEPIAPSTVRCTVFVECVHTSAPEKMRWVAILTRMT